MAQAEARAQLGPTPPTGLPPLSAIVSIPFGGTEEGPAFPRGRQTSGEDHLGRR